MLLANRRSRRAVQPFAVYPSVFGQPRNHAVHAAAQHLRLEFLEEARVAHIMPRAAVNIADAGPPSYLLAGRSKRDEGGTEDDDASLRPGFAVRHLVKSVPSSRAASRPFLMVATSSLFSCFATKPWDS